MSENSNLSECEILVLDVFEKLISLFLSGFEQQNRTKDIDIILNNIFISLILQTDRKNGLKSVSETNSIYFKIIIWNMEKKHYFNSL